MLLHKHQLLALATNRVYRIDPPRKHNMTSAEAYYLCESKLAAALASNDETTARALLEEADAALQQCKYDMPTNGASTQAYITAAKSKSWRDLLREWLEKARQELIKAIPAAIAG